MATPNPLPRAVYHKMMDTDYFTQWLEAKPILIETGHCKLQMVVRKEMLNGFGILHGGVAFALADSTLAFAANSYGRLALSINAHITYSQSAKVGETLIAEAKTLHLGYKTGDFDVNIANEDEVILYYFRGTVYRSSAPVITEITET